MPSCCCCCQQPLLPSQGQSTSICMCCGCCQAEGHLEGQLPVKLTTAPGWADSSACKASASPPSTQPAASAGPAAPLSGPKPAAAAAALPPEPTAAMTAFAAAVRLLRTACQLPRTSRPSPSRCHRPPAASCLWMVSGAWFTLQQHKASNRTAASADVPSLRMVTAAPLQPATYLQNHGVTA